ncbi:MAG: glycerophosphodiester phosphodiesterase [Clostridia bacterium]|nr:glycerophosphodiester phosphodiesterase [Clostridia bacterium]
MNNNFINYAHRGAPSYCPENTMLSFYTGVFMGANGIETDVQVTKDGVLVLFHDDTLERVTGEKGSIKDYTYKELQKFWVKKDNFKDKIPTFEDFLLHFKDFNLTFAIELKVGGVEKAVADMIKKYGVQEKVIVTSFNYDYLKIFKSFAPNIKLGYLTDKVDNSTIEKLLNDKFYEICPEGRLVNKENVDKWHSLGLNVRAWGIYNEEIMKAVYNAGVDGMTVNFPDKLTGDIFDNYENE